MYVTLETLLLKNGEEGIACKLFQDQDGCFDQISGKIYLRALVIWDHIYNSDPEFGDKVVFCHFHELLWEEPNGLDLSEGK